MATPINLSVLKAFDVLDLFGPGRPLLTAETVARDLGMSYATAHRFLSTLALAGILTTVRRGAFAPGPRLVQLGDVARELAPLPQNLTEVLDAARDALGESVMACRFTPRGPFCVAVSSARRAISVNIRVGTTLPMLKSAQGHLFLAGMDAATREAWAAGQGAAPNAIHGLDTTLTAVRAQGHALNRGGNEPDIGAVSVPVVVRDRVALTVSAFGFLGRFDAAFNDRAVSILKHAATAIAEA